jgi:predicted transcriptional regulator
MTLNITLDDRLGEQLASLAQATSRTPEQIATAVIERDLARREQLDAVLAPIRAAFAASGLTEDELGDLLEAEKHAMRAERRAAEAS